MTWRTSRYKQMVIDLLKNNDTIVVLDTETVGLKKKCQIVQFSAIRYRYEKNPFFHAGSGEAGPVYPSG